jgi:hypothetical protein
MDVGSVKWRTVFIMTIIAQIIALLFKRKWNSPLRTLMASITVFNGLMGKKPEDFLLFAAMGTVTREAMVAGQGIIFMRLGNNVCFMAIKANTIF